MEPPTDFICPITAELMSDPVLTCDGHTYERSAISEWLRENNTSPNTGAVLESRSLTDNIALRKAISDWAERHLRQINRSAISFDPSQPLGVGSFKSVFRGTLSVARAGGVCTKPVAVMKVRTGSVQAEVDAFLELGHHPRLVRFLGQCIEGPEQLLLTELAPLGSLADRMEEIQGQLTPGHVSAMRFQVCSGMEAIAAKGMVHGDLALRNLLLFVFDPEDVSKTSIKVTDYGLSAHTYSRTHVTIQSQEVPIRCLLVVGGGLGEPGAGTCRQRLCKGGGSARRATFGRLA